MAVEMSEKEERYWNSLDTPLLSHTKSCLCSECKVLRIKRKYNIREKSATEESERRRELFEQLKSLGVNVDQEPIKNDVSVSRNSQKVAEISNEMKPQNENIVSNFDDIIKKEEGDRSIIEEENRRKIEAQLKKLGL
ncbi:hypothetical protein [Lactococcus lactis]|uniref:Uncharacterized protein n=2 Tax=Lactococcus lactis TaxID=1358 RepID=A0A2A5SAN1_LACLH|nr:hypothetical protein [Lactococcus lactis]KAA8700939.1 hypothetical protein F4V48_09815 [Lactococcus lactis subsp. hordniae]KSU05791.1 hypothetical protein LMG8520_2377 [Lactococcus lactis subsp. lactis]MCT0449315.1 hypothetical protein [Lactococcus lactis subsp. lactis]MCT3135178.1 hypothetical protein [Lactococcus lactis]PCS10559.1 hypothetical protein RU90_GL001269 [Lactococcus lactis subsp. hordniae]